MKLKFSTPKEVNQICTFDFLGLSGLLLPKNSTFSLGEQVEVSLEVNGEYWGSAQTKVVWQNIHAPNTTHTPQGSFLKFVSSDEKLKQQLNMNT